MEATNSTFGKFRTCSGVEISIDVVADIAKKAGAAIMEVYNDTPLNEWSKIADFKADGSPLTVADKRANDIICSALLKEYPTIPIMSEENAEDPYEVRRKWKEFWCVDPLDGTKEFIKRNGQFTVNIGYVQGQTPMAGVVYVPATSTMYKGVKGLGPPVKETDDEVGYDSYKSIFCAQFKETDANLKIVASASHNTPETEAFVSRFDSPELKSYGSSLKLLMIAEGSAHIYPRMAPTMEWDTCAAHAIVDCAGGEVLQYEGGPACDNGAPVVYNKEDTHNPFFVVYGKRDKPKPYDGPTFGGSGAKLLLITFVVAPLAVGLVAFVLGVAE